MIFAGFVVWLRRRCHLLDSLFGDDSCRWGVKDLLKALQLEPVHSAGIGGGQEMMFSSAKSLLLSLSRLPLPVTCCYITELSHMSMMKLHGFISPSDDPPPQYNLNICSISRSWASQVQRVKGQVCQSCSSCCQPVNKYSSDASHFYAEPLPLCQQPPVNSAQLPRMPGLAAGDDWLTQTMNTIKCAYS